MNRRNAIQKVAIILGSTFSAPTLMAMQCWEQSEKANFNSVIFTLNDMQKQIVTQVAEMIIPKTETAGAIDAGVPAFIEMMLKDCYRSPEHSSFLEGITELENVKLLEMDASKMIETLKKVEADTKIKMKLREVKQTKMGDNDDKEEMKKQSKGLPFWRLMKELTLLGYYTSEIGIKSSFDYVQIPGKLEVIKLNPNQKAFAY
jgi:hypothetical protein